MKPSLPTPSKRVNTWRAALMRPALAALVILIAKGPLPEPSSVASARGQGRSPKEILRAVAQNGQQIMATLRESEYLEEVTVEAVSQADTITGKFYRVSKVSFGPEGARRERVLEQKTTLPPEVHIGAATLANLLSVYKFIITPDTFEKYEVNYVGREQVDELGTYVFDIAPKSKVPENSQERFLRGRVWVDDQDLCAVKVSGDVLPEQRSRRTPRFETYYHNQGRLWLPSYISADDRIRMDKYSTRVIVKVNYTSYKKANAKG